MQSIYPYLRSYLGKKILQMFQISKDFVSGTRIL